MNNSAFGIQDLRLCHLLTWPNYYDGYGFTILYFNDGCVVKNVEPGSPAEAGGIQLNDRILEVNGKKVRGLKDRNAIMNEINVYKNLSRSTYNISTSPNQNTANMRDYLNVLVVDPNTYNILKKRKVDPSAKNKNLRIRDIYTPPDPPGTVPQPNIIQPPPQVIPQPVPKPVIPPVIYGIPANPPPISDSDFLIKRCTLRKPYSNKEQALGFEMTKRGTQPHYISRVQANSIADQANLKTGDYIIELNKNNVENDDNGTLRDKIFESLRPENGSKFQLTIFDKRAYEYCIANKLPFSEFIRLHSSAIKYYDTPQESFNVTRLDPQEPAYQYKPPYTIPQPSYQPIIQPIIQPISSIQSIPVRRDDNFNDDYYISDTTFYRNLNAIPRSRSPSPILRQPHQFGNDQTNIYRNDYRNFRSSMTDLNELSANSHFYNEIPIANTYRSYSPTYDPIDPSPQLTERLVYVTNKYHYKIGGAERPVLSHSNVDLMSYF